MIRACTSRTVYSVCRTVQSGYPGKVDPAHFMQQMQPGKIKGSELFVKRYLGLRKKIKVCIFIYYINFKCWNLLSLSWMSNFDILDFLSVWTIYSFFLKPFKAVVILTLDGERHLQMVDFLSTINSILWHLSLFRW